MRALVPRRSARALAFRVLLGVAIATLSVGALGGFSAELGPRAAALSAHATPFSSSGGGGGSPGPSITSFSVTPASVTIPGTVEFRVNATGGTPPLSYVYTGLPAGCTSKNVSSFGCSPSAAATTNVTVTVRDSAGQQDQAVALLVVLPAPALTVFGLPAWEASTVLAVIAAILAVLVLVRMGRKKRGPRVAPVSANTGSSREAR
ncbi:MAG: hypothetical protein L3J97_02240 [Thermoplasmata archaeon]|nr:hypothetical protein [Thermoplasmata archaeon]